MKFKRLFLILIVIALFTLCSCSNSDVKKVIKSINDTYGVEILAYADPVACRYNAYWDGSDCNGVFALKVDGGQFMDAFHEVKRKTDERTVEYRSGWILYGKTESSDIRENVAELLKKFSEECGIDFTQLTTEDFYCYGTEEVQSTHEYMVLFPEPNRVYFYKVTY